MVGFVFALVGLIVAGYLLLAAAALALSAVMGIAEWLEQIALRITAYRRRRSAGPTATP